MARMVMGDFMGRRVSIPVRVIRPEEDREDAPWPRRGEEARAARDERALDNERALDEQRTLNGERAQHDQRVQTEERVRNGGPGTGGAEAKAPAVPATDPAPERVPEQASEQARERAAGDTAGPDAWRERTIRLQADMENYRKRQRRLAQDQIEDERRRLLGAFLPVIDDLERALATPRGSEAALRQGVELTHRAAQQLLQREGVEKIEPRGQAFDPNWHEAVATVPRDGRGVGPDTVVEVVGPGYRLGDRLLRPARVIVAV